MNTTNEDKLNIINAVIALIEPNHVEIKDISKPLLELGLDSFDIVTMFIYLADIYGVGDKEFETMEPPEGTTRSLNVEDIITTINNCHRDDPSLEEAIESIK